MGLEHGKRVSGWDCLVITIVLLHDHTETRELVQRVVHIKVNVCAHGALLAHLVQKLFNALIELLGLARALVEESAVCEDCLLGLLLGHLIHQINNRARIVVERLVVQRAA